MFDTVLVADRGETARRVVRTCQRLGIRAVTVHSVADARALHVTESDESVLLGEAPAAQSYLDGLKVVEAARQTGAQAVHPGCGLLAESAAFARAVVDAGLVWIGPPADVIHLTSDKVTARTVMAAAGLPVPPGSPTAPLDPVRHIEVQILGLADGQVVTLGERDCSVQRRDQKVVEESPAAGLTPDLRSRLLAAACTAGEAVGYRNAGTVRFLVSGSDVVFLELTPRLQVGHPMTEAVTGADLVEAQLRLAAGEKGSYDADLQPRGHAIELRVYAEDPVSFLPSPGPITAWHEPTGDGIRVDAGYRRGDAVSPHYDPLLATLIVTAPTRAEAMERARNAVAAFVIEGPQVNLSFLAELLTDPEFVSGDYDTGLVARMRGTT